MVLALSVGLGTALWQWRIAQVESENQKASKEFVIGLFKSVADNTPAGLSPADATAKQMLDIGTRQLFAEHSADSQVRLDLLLLLSELNESLDLLDTSLKSADEAAALAARLYGEQDVRYAEALEAKAEVLTSKGEYAPAIEIGERILTIIGRPTAQTSELFAKTQILLGNARNQIESPESTKPREHLESALKVLNAAGSRSVDLSRANFYLARTWEGIGEYARAEPYYVDGIKAAEANFGAGSYIAAFGYDNFGDMLRHLHRFDEGEKYVRAAGATYRTLYGPQHAKVAMTDINLALILAAQGRRAEADKNVTEAIALAIATRGADSFMTAGFRMHLARMKIAMGELREAREVIDAILTTLGKDEANRRPMMGASIDQARVLILLDEQTRAETLIGQISAAFAGTPDASSPRAARLELRRGELRLAAGDSGGAREHFNLALDRALKLGESASDAFPETLFVYTQILPDAALARTTLASLESLPIIKTVRAGGTLSIDETIQLRTALGRLEQASGDLPAARKDLDEALRLRTAHDDPASPWLAQIQGMIAEQDAQAGDLPAARAALAQAELTLARGKTDLPYFSKPMTELRARLAKT